MPRIIVTINGTDTNPFAKWGMTHNPFPQLGAAETDGFESIVARLDGEPVTGPEDIRKRLKGCAPAFIEGCVQRYQPGERVRFELTWGRS